MAKRFFAPAACVGAAIALHAALGCLYGLSRLYEFKTLGFDLGAFTQALHAIVATGMPLSTLTPLLAEQHWFGFHFSPLLYVIAPLTAVFPGPALLQIIQACCCSIAAWPVYLAVRQLGASPRQAAGWAMAYLLNPFILNAAVWDFHEACLAIPAMAFGLWAVAARRFGALLLCCLALLADKEHYGLGVAGFGLLWGLRHGEWRRAAGVSLFGLLTCAAVLGLIMPWLRHGAANPLLNAQGSSATPHYQWLFHPADWLSALPPLLAQNLVYAGYLLAPLCLLPLGGLAWLLPAIGDLAVISLSQDDFYRSVLSYHSAALIPALVIAAYQGSAALAKTPWLPIPQPRLAGYALLLSALCGWLFAPFPLPLAKNLWEAGAPRLHPGVDDQRAIADIRRLIPEDARLAAQCNIGAWFSERPVIGVFPFVQGQYVALKLDFPFRRTLIAMGAPYCVTPQDYRAQVALLLGSPQWGIRYWHAPWLVLERGIPDQAPRGEALAALAALERAQQDIKSKGHP